MGSNAQDVLDTLMANASNVIARPSYEAGDFLSGKWNKKWNQWEADVNSYVANLLYQKDQRKREDSQYSRMVNDLKSIGVNPYYALNSNGSFGGYSTNAADIFSGRSSNSSSGASSKNLSSVALSAASMILKLIAVLAA